LSALTSALRRPELLVETSALVAILFEEPEWEAFTDRILAAKTLTTSVNVFETVLALTKLVANPPTEAHARVLKLAHRLAIEIISLTQEMIPHAVLARERYGRGRKGLNMGDCLSYAAAKQLGLKLLYKGDDFAATDVND
jgi:ribonuclease VapC